MRRAIENALIITWMKFYPIFRTQPYIVIIQAAISGSPLFFFLIAGSFTGFENGIAGAMIATVSFIGLTSSAHEVSFDEFTKTKEMLVAMQVHPASYAIGIALAPLLISLPGLFSFIAIAAWLGLVSQVTICWLLAALMLCWASISILGFTISTYMAKLPLFTQNSITRLLSLSIVFLPPVYYSETALRQFGWVSYLFPTSNAASLIRTYLGLSAFSIETVILHWLTLIGTTMAFILLACFKTRWRES